MNILQPLLDIQQNLRIELDRMKSEVTNIQQLEALPLKPCAFCQSENVKCIGYPVPNEPRQHQIVIRCECGIQTIPQTCFETEPGTFYSATYDAREIWNGANQ